MPRLAAVCRTCHRPFASGYYVGPGSSGNQFVGNLDGPCPWCGAPCGVIPDGVLDVDANDVVRLSRALPTTDAALIKLAGIMQAADLSPDADPEAVLARIASEVPDATALLRVLRDPAFGSVVVALTLILALLAFLGVHA